MPEFDFALVGVRILQDIPFYSSLRYPLRSGASFLFHLFHYTFLSPILLLLPLSFVGAISFGSDRTGVGVLAIGRHEGVALLLFANSVGVCCDDASVEGLIV